MVTQEDHYSKQIIVASNKRQVSLAQVESLASIHCTIDEMAGVLGVSSTWLREEIERNPLMQFAIDRGLSNFKESLRRKQYEVAMSGEVRMLIWLGKQYLNQADKQEVKEERTVNVLVKNAMEELGQISKEQLLEARKMLQAKTIENGEE